MYTNHGSIIRTLKLNVFGLKQSRKFSYIHTNGIVFIIGRKETIQTLD